MTKHHDSDYRVRGGFLVRRDTDSEVLSRARALDARRRSFSPGDDEEDPDVIEVHNHIPMSEPEPSDYYDRALARDDEEQEEGGEEGEAVARYPANGFTVVTEDVEGEPHHVVYRSAGGKRPKHKTDIYEMDTRDSRSPRPPRSLRELNAFFRAHYKRAGRR